MSYYINGWIITYVTISIYSYMIKYSDRFMLERLFYSYIKEISIMQENLNEKYNILTTYKVRLKYYLGFGTYLEIKHYTQDKFYSMRRLSKLDITKGD